MMNKLADDLCAEIRNQCEQAVHFKGLWLQANNELDVFKQVVSEVRKAIGAPESCSTTDEVRRMVTQQKQLLESIKDLVPAGIEHVCDECGGNSNNCQSDCPVRCARNLITEIESAK